MQKLQFLIDMLTKGRKLHISILDVSGVLNSPLTKISFENVIHSKSFCDIAKSTERGFRFCLRCKELANTKALTYKNAFCGHCMYGIYEVAVPVIIEESVAAIVYVGNAIIDGELTKDRIDKVCRYTKVDGALLREQAEECEYVNDTGELFGIAEIVCDYIKTLYQTESKATEQLHWLVSALKEHADRTYCLNPTLKELSVIYHKNEKYMGRLFKKEMGTSFHKYCLSLRLQKAEALLSKSESKVIDVALECGFNNISYFNRTFKAKYGTSPTEYVLSKS